MISFLRHVWAAPCSVIGLLIAIAALPFGATVVRIDDTLEVALVQRLRNSLRLRNILPFSAITLGHVIIGIDAELLERLRSHERAHVHQYERWGTIFLVAYPLSSLVQLARGRRPYWDNHFEVQARNESAGALTTHLG